MGRPTAHRTSAPVQLLIALVTTAIATYVGAAASSALGGHSLFLLLGAVMISALYGGLLGGVTASILAALAHSFYFQYPRGYLTISSLQDAFELLLFLSVSLFLTYVSSSVRRSQQEAEEASRRREDILGIVSHDLKNSLTALRSNAELVLRVWNTGQTGLDIRKPLERIVRTGDQMNKMITDLLDYERIRSGTLKIEMKLEDPKTLIQESLDLVRPLAEQKKISLLDDSPGGIQILCDRLRIQQVLLNLLVNAVKFTDLGGQVRVTLDVGSGRQVFSVADTGKGISEEHLPHVFDRYWQANQPGTQGTGLGLAISKGIVEAHGGKIWVESRIGQGSTFYFSIPTPGAESQRQAA